jgi:hypothetical protein
MRASEITLGPFRVDQQGLLSPADPDCFPRFAVRWRDRLVQAHMRQPSAGNTRHGTLNLSSRIGRVPSTAGPTPSAANRTTILDVLRQLPRLLPAGWRMRLMPDHSVLVEAQTELILPVSAISLVTEMSLFLLSLAPYLDVLDAEGIGAAAFGSDVTDGGTVNT